MKQVFTKSSVILSFITIVITLLFPSCLKDNFDFNKLAKTNWEPSIAVPLVNSSLNVYDLMAHKDPSELIVIDSILKLMALVYEGELFSFKASDIISLPYQSTSQSFSLSSTEITTFTGTGTISKSLNYTYIFTTSSGVKIDSMALKAGSIDVDINSDFQHSGSVQIKIPSMTKNGKAFDEIISINYAGSPVGVSNSYDISGYTIDMTNGGTSYNEIPIKYIFTLNNSGNPINSSDGISINQAFSGLEFSKVFGDFGQQTVSLDMDSVNIKIFNSAASGTFSLVDPKLKIYITNSFGFPVDVEFTTLASINIPTGTITPIDYNGFDNPFSINYPLISQIGTSVETNLVMDKTNSNITILMEPTPKYLVHAIKATANPSGTPVTPNFITDQSEFIMDTELELSLNGFAYNWAFADTIDFSLGEQDSIKEIKSITIRAIFTNGFPINARIQLLLTDSNYVVLDSLLDNRYDNLIVSGQVDSDGRVIQPTTKITDIPYDNSRLPNLLKARKIIIWARGETIDYQSQANMKIFEDYKLNIQLGLKADIKMKF